MNIEELKLILETVNSVAGDTKTVLIWWFVLDFSKYLLGAGTAIGILWVVMKFITGMHEWSALGKSMSRAWGGDGGSWVYRADEIAADKAIRAAKEQTK